MTSRDPHWFYRPRQPDPVELRHREEDAWLAAQAELARIPTQPARPSNARLVVGLILLVLITAALTSLALSDYGWAVAIPVGVFAAAWSVGAAAQPRRRR